MPLPNLTLERWSTDSISSVDVTDKNLRDPNIQMCYHRRKSIGIESYAQRCSPVPFFKLALGVYTITFSQVFLVNSKEKTKVGRGGKTRKPPVDTHSVLGATAPLASKQSFSDFCVSGIGSSTEAESKSLSSYSDKDDGCINRAL